MEITSLILNVGGTLSINTRECSENGNSDNCIIITVEDTKLFLESYGDCSKTILENIIELTNLNNGTK